MEVTASINSSGQLHQTPFLANLDIGGNRRQELSSNAIDQSFPSIHLTPTTITITPWLTWSPTFSYTNDQRFHQIGTQLLIAGGPGSKGADTLPQFYNDRRTNITIGTPIRIGRWNWSNNVTIVDVRSNNRAEFTLPGDTAITVSGGCCSAGRSRRRSIGRRASICRRFSPARGRSSRA